MSYTFQDKTYDDIFSLAKDLYKSLEWADALRSKEFAAFVESQDESKAKRIDKVLMLSVPDDVMIFHIGCILNPFMPFSFHGYVFKDYVELGKKLLSFSPTPDPVLQSLIRYELVSKHMETTFYNNSHQEEYETVKKIEKLGRDDMPYAYFSLGYYLSKNTTIIYDHILYQDLYNLTYFLVKKEKDLNALGSYLSFSPLLKAYSEYSPEGEKIKQYLHLCDKVDSSAKELEDFLNRRKK